MDEIDDVGDVSFESADSANVPVNLWLTEDEDEPGWWVLEAGNYMPRKNHVTPTAYVARSKSKEALRDLVTKRVVPLYETALARVKAMAEGDGERLYYWE